MVLDPMAKLLPLLDCSSIDELEPPPIINYCTIKMFENEAEAHEFVLNNDSIICTFAREYGYYIYNENSCK
jgi:hypothetical protein